MRTQTKPAQFVKYEPGAGKVLTIIANVAEASPLNKHADLENPAEAKLREIEARIRDAKELEQFHRCADLVRPLMKSYRPHAKSVVVFSQADGMVSTRELNVSLATEVCWQDLPHIQPLVEAADEFEEILIVLMDGRRSRFITSFLGGITEHPDIVNPFPTAHTQTPGNDRQKSQPTFHRKADEHEHQYLKSVAAMTASMAESRTINRVILSGNNTACKELYFLLPKPCQKHVISFVVLPAQATHEEIARGVASAQERAERDNEAAKVTSLLDRSGASDRAVTGVDATMAALTEGRVHELVYAQGIALKGARCKACDSIVVNQTACPKCKAAFASAEDAMDLIIATALDTGATVEQVRDKPAERLTPVGGIGAFLRY